VSRQIPPIRKTRKTACPKTARFAGTIAIGTVRYRSVPQVILGREIIMKRVAFYIRVSTSKQDTENQRRELEAVADRSGWKVVKVYEDAGISGAKGRDKRPDFDRLIKDETARKINMLRLGPSIGSAAAFKIWLVSLLNCRRLVAISTFISKRSIRARHQDGPCSRCLAYLLISNGA
jgi:hypothetical protein